MHGTEPGLSGESTKWTNTKPSTGQSRGYRMGRPIDISGERFGKLRVLDRADSAADGTLRWRCICDCGQERTIHGTALRAGRHKSCGCSSPRFKPGQGSSHGASRSNLYAIWRGMLTRCSPKCSPRSIGRYYGRGIRVCSRWLTFENFRADMGERPSPEHSIDRIDGNGNYEPGNCRWATKAEQANNSSWNHVVHCRGKAQTVSQWAAEIGVKPNTLIYRLRRGISPDEALQKTYVQARSAAKAARTRPCQQCGGAFLPRTGQLRAGRGRFCSQSCNAASRRKV